MRNWLRVCFCTVFALTLVGCNTESDQLGEIQKDLKEVKESLKGLDTKLDGVKQDVRESGKGMGSPAPFGAPSASLGGKDGLSFVGLFDEAPTVEDVTSPEVTKEPPEDSTKETPPDFIPKGFDLSKTLAKLDTPKSGICTCEHCSCGSVLNTNTPKITQSTPKVSTGSYICGPSGCYQVNSGYSSGNNTSYRVTRRGRVIYLK